jgi:hypothetical protein
MRPGPPHPVVAWMTKERLMIIGGVLGGLILANQFVGAYEPYIPAWRGYVREQVTPVQLDFKRLEQSLNEQRKDSLHREKFELELRARKGGVGGGERELIDRRRQEIDRSLMGIDSYRSGK